MLLERAPFDLRGGNSRFTAGGMRFRVRGATRRSASWFRTSAIPSWSRTDFGAYTWDQFYDDMCRITQYRADPDLVVKLVDESYDTLKWMAGHGGPVPAHVRTAVVQGRGYGPVLGRFDARGAWGGGPGLVDSLTSIAEGMGIDIRYGVRGEALPPDGVRVGTETVKADAVCARLRRV